MSSISLYSSFSKKKKTSSGRVFLRSVYQTPSTDYLNIYTIREKKKKMTSRSKVKQMKSCEKADARVAVFFFL